MIRALRRCAALLLAAGAVARAGAAESGQDLPMFTATLDALVADERAQGGWTFAPAADGGRPPFTLVMQIAERVARPVGLARWDLPPVSLAGDPGACPGMVDALHVGHGARGLMAEAGMQLAVLEPPAISPCAGTPMEVVAADGLR